VDTLRTAAALALLLLAPSTPASPTLERQEAAAPDEPRCGLLASGSEGAAVGDCLRCHAGSGSGHPVGLDYARAAGRSGHGIPLRAAEVAIGRGAFLPGGELRCTTCHDRRSPWRFRLALPPGAAIRPAVDRRDPATFDPAAGPAPAVRAGDAVGTKPLCLLCHALD
jgi:hypothetical protein